MYEGESERARKRAIEQERERAKERETERASEIARITQVSFTS